jgi:hypothetical protein
MKPMKRSWILAASFFLATSSYAGNSVSVATDEDMAVFEKQMVQDKQRSQGTTRLGGAKGPTTDRFGSEASSEARKLRESISSGTRGQALRPAIGAKRGSGGGNDGGDNRVSKDTGSVRSAAKDAAETRGKSGIHGKSRH